MGLLAKFLHKAFYNPYKAVALCSNVVVGEATQFTKSFHVRFDVPRSDVALCIGSRCFLQNYFIFESDQGKITVGDGTFINGDTMVISRASIDIGRSVTIAWGCVIYDHDSHSLSYLDRVADQNQTLIDYPLGNMVAHKDWKHVNSAPIRICDHAWLGFDVVILKGVTVGEGAIVGARSVVTKDVPPWTIVAGNPARVIKELPLEHRRA